MIAQLLVKTLREMKLNKAKLPSGSTVAHLAYYLAEHLGCDPIIFVGQDLGFSDGLAATTQEGAQLALTHRAKPTAVAAAHRGPAGASLGTVWFGAAGSGT